MPTLTADNTTTPPSLDTPPTTTMPNASTMSDSPLTQPSANAKPRPIWERYGKLRPNPSQSPTRPSSVIITDSRGSLPILTDSADPRHPTDFTDTTCSVLWAEPAPLPSDFWTPPPKIMGHRPPPSLEGSSLSPPFLTLPNPFKSPNVQSLSPIPTIYDLMNASMMIKTLPNPYSLSLTL